MGNLNEGLWRFRNFWWSIPIIGLCLSTLIAMLKATPIQWVYDILTEIAHKSLIKPVSIAIELLAAIPSIIYGIGVYSTLPL